MTTRCSLLLGTLVALLSSCCVPSGEICRSYSLGPAYDGERRLYARPSHVADHGYPSVCEPVHHHREPAYTMGNIGYGTDCNSQIPYFFR